SSSAFCNVSRSTLSSFLIAPSFILIQFCDKRTQVLLFATGTSFYQLAIFKSCQKRKIVYSCRLAGFRVFLGIYFKKNYILKFFLIAHSLILGRKQTAATTPIGIVLYHYLFVAFQFFFKLRVSYCYYSHVKYILVLILI